MPPRTVPVVLTPSVGWNTDMSDISRQFDHWLTAENVTYEANGSARKWGGTYPLNSAIAGTPTVRGLFEYWKSVGGFEGWLMAQAGTKVYKMDRSGNIPDGTWDDISGAVTITDDSLPLYAVLEDQVVVTTSEADAPYTWNGVGNAAALAGTPPASRCCCTHNNRMWLGSTTANPSRIYYSADLDPTDWTSADSGSIDIDPNDGDRVIGMVSAFGRLVIFKGPNHGSIHIISGTAPTGADAYSHQVVMRGIPAITPRAIIPVGNDIWFVSNRGIYSLANVQQYGDYAAALVTNGLQSFWRDTINRGQLTQAVGNYYSEKGIVVFSLAKNGSAVNNMLLLVHTDLQNRMSTVSRGAACLRTIQSTSGSRFLYAGEYSTGVVNREDYPSRSLNGTIGYYARMKTPHLLLGSGDGQINLREMWLRVKPHAGNISVLIQRDANTPQTVIFTQGTTGGILDDGPFILDASFLGGAYTTPSRKTIEGPARAVSVEITQGGVNEDMELLEFGLIVERSDDRMEA
jgi:hypothetical protein